MDLKRFRLERTDSTNSFLSRLLKDGAVAGAVSVFADYQEVGRGRGRNSWESSPGMNLLGSMLVFPAFLSASEQFALSQSTSLAICDLLSGLGVSPRIKWPNDILAGRGKIAGILIENGIRGSSLSHSIVGMGINLNQDRFRDYLIPATSLVMEGFPRVDIGVEADKLEGLFMDRYEQLYRGSHICEKEYLHYLYGYDESCTFEKGGQRFRGVIRGTDGQGGLLVESGGRVHTHLFGEIRQLVNPVQPEKGNQRPPSGQ